MNHNYILGVLMVVLAGCASSSGVVPIGSDTYSISRSNKSIDPSGAKVKADALIEANQYCADKGKQVELLKSDQKDMVLFSSDAQAEIEFRCVTGKGATEKLRELESMHKQGLINDSEYAGKKKAILDAM